MDDAERRYSGYPDRHGQKLYEGDIVRFWSDAERGHSLVPHPDYTEMIDEVIVIDDIFYLADPDIDMAAFIWRHNKYCEKIGNIFDNPELIMVRKEVF